MTRSGPTITWVRGIAFIWRNLDKQSDGLIRSVITSIQQSPQYMRIQP